jgi:O-antigen/teichoic acid export membrane protein
VWKGAGPLASIRYRFETLERALRAKSESLGEQIDQLKPSASGGIEATLSPYITLNRIQARDRALRAAMASALLVRLATVGIGVLSVAVSVRAIGETGFGVLATISTFAGLLGFADLGIGGGLMTRLAIAEGQGDVRRARSMVSAALWGMIGIGLLVMVLGLVAARLLPWERILGVQGIDSGELRNAVAVFFLFAGLGIPSAIGQRMQMGLQRGMAANAWSLAGVIASFMVLLVVAAGRAQLWCFVAASLGIPVIVAAIQSIWVLHERRSRLRPSWRLVNRESVRSLAGVSGLFLVVNVAVAVAIQSDAVIVASTLGAGAAAVFAVGLRMFGLIAGTLARASQQMWTAMAEALASGDIAWVRSRFRRMLLGTFAVSIPCSILLVVVGRPLSRIWVGAQLVPPHTLLIAFAIWTVYSLAMTQVSFLLNAACVIGPQIFMAVTMTIANLILSLYLTRRIGIAGPLVGSLVSHVALSGIPAVILAKRVLSGR